MLTHRTKKNRIATGLALWLALLLLCLCGCGQRRVHAQPSAAPPSKHVHYWLTPEPDHGAWQVRVAWPRLPLGTTLCAPAIGTRSGEALQWQGLFTKQGRITMDWGRDGCFTLPTHVANQPFEVRYRVVLEPADRPAWRVTSLSPHAFDRTLMFPGETLFMEVIGAQGSTLKAQLDFLTEDLANDHALGSTLTTQHPHPRQLRVQNDALQRSMVWWNPAQQHATSRLQHDHTLRLVMSPSLAHVISPQYLASELACVVAQMDHWLDQPRRHDVTVLMVDARWDLSHLTGFLRGRAIVVQAGEEGLRMVARRRLLFAHELFHLYNGGVIHVATDERDTLAWFREGVTDYVSALILLNAGLIEADTFLSELSNHASSYLFDVPPARSRLEVRSRRPYDQGFLLALALDVMLREQTAGQRSLQGYWQWLLKQPSARPLTHRALREGLERYGRAGVESLLERYASPSTPLPLEALLEPLGLSVISHRTAVADFGFGVHYDAIKTELVVGAVSRDSAAWRAGLRPGDAIAVGDQTRLSRPGERLTLRVARSGGPWQLTLRAEQRWRPVVRVQAGGSQRTITGWRELWTRAPVGACHRLQAR